MILSYRIYFIVAIILYSSCAPVNSTFESAKMLSTGDFGVTGNFSNYSVSDKGEYLTTNNNGGVGLGYGLTEQVNLKLRYERLICTDTAYTSLNYSHIEAKFSLIKNILALTMPVGIYYVFDDVPEWVLSPKLIGTYPSTKRFDMTLSAKADIYPEQTDGVLLGLTYGAGFSTHLDKWAVRPEVGLMLDPGETYILWTWGIGFNYVFNLKDIFQQ